MPISSPYHPRLTPAGLPGGPLRFGNTVPLGLGLADWPEARDIYLTDRKKASNRLTVMAMRKQVHQETVERVRRLQDLAIQAKQSVDSMQRHQGWLAPRKLKALNQALDDLLPSLYVISQALNEPDARQQDHILQATQNARRHLAPFLARDREGRRMLDALSLHPVLVQDIETMNVLLQQIRSDHGTLKALNDFNLMIADGLARDRVYHTPPEALSGQLKSRWGHDVADVLVIGAGPAGIATALHATQKGLKTILVDAGYAFQSFSDQLMLPVHVMRTNALRSSLTNEQISDPALHRRHNMTVHLKHFRERGYAARTFMKEQTGRDYIGNPPPADNLKPDIPVARNELFQYFDGLLDAVGEHPNGVVLEQAAIVPGGEYKRGVFHLKTARGHELKARNVVLATGSVGSYGEYVRGNPLFHQLSDVHPDRYIPLWDRHDLVTENDRLLSLYEELARKTSPKAQLIISDPLIGSRSVQDIVSVLPAGTRCMVVGGGESGAKGALELLNLNPEVTVDLFVQAPLRADQLQVPAANAQTDEMLRCVQQPFHAFDTLREWKEEFGVPITPQTLKDLQEKEREGRVKIHVLNAKLDPHTVSMVHNADGSGTTVYLKKKKGPPEKLAVVNGPIVSAIGYDRKAMRQSDPVVQDWIRRNLLEPNPEGLPYLDTELALSPEDGVSSVDHPHVYTVGACNYAMAADSAIFGMPVRATLVVDDIIRENKRRSGLGGLLSGLLGG